MAPFEPSASGSAKTVAVVAVVAVAAWYALPLLKSLGSIVADATGIVSDASRAVSSTITNRYIRPVLVSAVINPVLTPITGAYEGGRWLYHQIF